ncbi:hypothetical protein CDAR_416621 [Caerostris darwini]|uniref:Uncharacterized protein n=1 Tax=Caerostris darwini TaxID=1538125 RepID=A0AAV4MII8_9ARAC|nr:hypothetical protein CDAR_416621 [Caerostris darwini]
MLPSDDSITAEQQTISNTPRPLEQGPPASSATRRQLVIPSGLWPSALNIEAPSKISSGMSIGWRPGVPSGKNTTSLGDSSSSSSLFFFIVCCLPPYFFFVLPSGFWRTSSTSS